MALARRVFTIGGWTLLSRVLGLLRDRLFAASLGASSLLDAFLLAFQIPNLLRNLFGEGALSAAVIPRYVQYHAVDPGKADRFAGQVLTRLAFGLSALTVVAMAVAATVMLTGPGNPVYDACDAVLGHPPGGVGLVARLALPQLPFMVFICVSAIMAGVLNGRRHFAVPAAAPVLLNLCLIATAWMERDREVFALPYAVLAAGVSQVVLHTWALTRTGGIPPVGFGSGQELRELRGAMAPVLIASSIYQINAFLDSVIAYHFLETDWPGAVAILYFGNRLLQFPMALVGHGVTTAAYPELSARASQGWAASGVVLREASRALGFFLLPAAVGLLVISEPLVRTIYQTHAFDEVAVARTVLVTRMLALALLPISLNKLQVRLFHAHRDQRTPMVVSIALVALNLALNLLLVRTDLHEAGLALATAISSFVGWIIYALILRRRGAGVALDLPLRSLIATAAMAAAVGALVHFWPQPAGSRSGFAALRLSAAVALGAVVYLGLAGTAWIRPKPTG